MDSDLEDDWLFDSIRKYKSLYMYNLQKAVESAEWITEESVVVCISDRRTHELLELSLPAHLSVDEANTGLTKDRDFELIAGGFSEKCITSLHHLHNTRKVVAAVKGDNSVEVWQLQTPDNNLTKKIGVIKNRVSNSAAAKACILGESQVLFGSHLSDVCLGDLITSSVISHLQAADNGTNCPLTTMVQQNGSVWTSDRHTGQLISLDPQTGLPTRVGPDLSEVGLEQDSHRDRSSSQRQGSKLEQSGHLDKTCSIGEGSEWRGTSKEGVRSSRSQGDSDLTRNESKESDGHSKDSDGCDIDSNLVKPVSDLCQRDMLNGQKRSDLNGHIENLEPSRDSTASDLSENGQDGNKKRELSETWSLCGDLSSSGQCLVQMSTSGLLCVRDLRNLKQCVMTLNTKLSTNSQDIHISMCPTEPSLLASTGFSGCVQLFDRTHWRDGRESTPIFVHDGHMAERSDQSQSITTNLHLWYPWKHKTVLSASSDGGLHIFQPVFL